jgi:hypothetical protein
MGGQGLQWGEVVFSVKNDYMFRLSTVPTLCGKNPVTTEIE